MKPTSWMHSTLPFLSFLLFFYHTHINTSDGMSPTTLNSLPTQDTIWHQTPIFSLFKVVLYFQQMKLKTMHLTLPSDCSPSFSPLWSRQQELNCLGFEGLSCSWCSSLCSSRVSFTYWSSHFPLHSVFSELCTPLVWVWNAIEFQGILDSALLWIVNRTKSTLPWSCLSTFPLCIERVGLSPVWG